MECVVSPAFAVRVTSKNGYLRFVGAAKDLPRISRLSGYARDDFAEVTAGQ